MYQYTMDCIICGKSAYRIGKKMKQFNSNESVHSVIILQGWVGNRIQSLEVEHRSIEINKEQLVIQVKQTKLRLYAYVLQHLLIITLLSKKKNKKNEGR